MSQGLGSLQRDALALLYAAEGGELPARELRQRIGDPDRSNFRRAVRGLLDRELAEEIGEGAGSRLSITFFGALVAYGPFDDPNGGRDPMRELRREREEVRRWLAECAREERRLRDAKRALFPRWEGQDYDPVRRPGPTQRKLLRVLWDWSDPLDAGLPVPALKRIVGGDRSNVRRSIRGLLVYGYLNQTPDGARLRISEALLHEYARMVLPAATIKVLMNAPDEDWARQVLREQGEELPVVGYDDRCRENGDFFARYC